jgi:mono/diheme cytochrome c family protein
VTELPEHLLKRAAEARARLTGEGGGGSDTSGGNTPAATPAVAAPVAAATPAVPEEPKAPEPVAPYVEAGLNRKTIPAWIIPVLLFLPIWAIYYVGYLENPPAEAGGLLVEGGEIYSGQCSSCHGGTGGGGTGRQLNDGQVLLTFPSAEAGMAYDGIAGQIAWVANGTAGTSTATYGDPARAGGARTPGSFGQMSGFGGGLSAEELVAVVYYERITHGGLDDAAAEAELHLLEELLRVMEEEGTDLDSGLQAEDVQHLIDIARASGDDAEQAAG